MAGVGAVVVLFGEGGVGGGEGGAGGGGYGGFCVGDCGGVEGLWGGRLSWGNCLIGGLLGVLFLFLF